MHALALVPFALVASASCRAIARHVRVADYRAYRQSGKPRRNWGDDRAAGIRGRIGLTRFRRRGGVSGWAGRVAGRCLRGEWGRGLEFLEAFLWAFFVFSYSAV